MRSSHLHLIAAAATVLISCSGLSCSGSKTPDAAALEASAAARILAIPDATAEKYNNPAAVKAWRNPYLIIRVDGVGLLDPNNHLEHILKPAELTQALANLPPSAWPYGRVVAVTENSVRTSPEDEVKIRQNRAVVAGTLKSLHVLIHWIPSA